MPYEYNKDVYCKAENIKKPVSFRFTENIIKTNPPQTIVMVACDYQNQCSHNECFYHADHLTECTKEYVNV